MSSLRETQENFQIYILNQDPAIEKDILGATEEFKRTRLDIYREGYSLRLLEILEKIFPGLLKLAGNQLFYRLGREYIAAYPSTYFSVSMFARHLSKFLASHIPSEPTFAEMAAFEWALEEVLFTTPNGPHLTFEKMTTIPPEAWAGLKLTLHPSFQKISFFHKNIPLLWESLISDENKEAPDLERSTEPAIWLLWRFELRGRYYPVSKEQLWMVEAIRAGKPFAEVCEGLCEWLSEDTVTQFAAENLRNWITDGMFSKVRFKK